MIMWGEWGGVMLVGRAMGVGMMVWLDKVSMISIWCVLGGLVGRCVGADVGGGMGLLYVPREAALVMMRLIAVHAAIPPGGHCRGKYKIRWGPEMYIWTFEKSLP